MTNGRPWGTNGHRAGWPRTSGAAPLAPDVRDEFEARVPSVIVYEGYGCTESASVISASPLGGRRKGSVGLPIAGCEVSIQDESGTPLPPGVDGYKPPADL